MDAVIYARISSDQEGRGLGVARQIQDCTAKAQAMGWNVSETYLDNDLSASKSVPRPEYQRLMQDVRNGSVQALVVYDLDRLTRKPMELEEFIILTSQTGVALANVSGDVDLTTANGKMIARIKGNVAAQEAERISERTTRQKRQYAESGKRLGGRYRMFGYDREWNVIEDEAVIVREVFKRMLQGESQNSITKDLKTRGVLTSSGKSWTPLATSRLVKNEAYAGINIYKGERLGTTAFDALIGEIIFNAVNRPLAASPTAVARNTHKHLMSGILVCDACKAKMVGATDNINKTVRYRCDHRQGGCGKVSIKAAWVDEVIHAWMSQMSVRDAYRQRMKQDDPDPMDSINAQKDALDARIATLQASGMDLEDLVPMIKQARSERRALDQVEAQALEVDMFAAVGEYEDLDVSAKRGRIAVYLKYMLVKPGTRSRVFDPTRLILHMQDGLVMPLQAITMNDFRDPEWRPGGAKQLAEMAKLTDGDS